MAKRAILYARVSTTKQAELYSLDYQIAQERQYAEEMGFDVVAEFADDASGNVKQGSVKEGMLIRGIIPLREK